MITSLLKLENRGEYIDLLTIMAKLSKLSSENECPLIHYRVVENIVCRSFKATNLSRADTAYDAKLNELGIGIKTFITNNTKSSQKVAEFNKQSPSLRKLKDRDLAIEVSKLRNKRIQFANDLYGIKNGIYHIVGRKKGAITLFEDEYAQINISKIKQVNGVGSSLTFRDDINAYSFNYSKSTLYKIFNVPKNAEEFPIEILDDPYKLLLQLLKDIGSLKVSEKLIYQGKDFIILPLYGISKGQKYVFPKSGLNQWNAGGRKRAYGELYIPVPRFIHNKYPQFFPDRDTAFELFTPNEKKFSAKICQDNGKALMTNPNKDIAEWLLKDLLKLEEGELATIEKLEELDFDSVIIRKNQNDQFFIDKAPYGEYERFCSI